jgi:hypothetical protein
VLARSVRRPHICVGAAAGASSRLWRRWITGIALAGIPRLIGSVRARTSRYLLRLRKLEDDEIAEKARTALRAKRHNLPSVISAISRFLCVESADTDRTNAEQEAKMPATATAKLPKEHEGEVRSFTQLPGSKPRRDQPRNWRINPAQRSSIGKI